MLGLRSTCLKDNSGANETMGPILHPAQLTFYTDACQCKADFRLASGEACQQKAEV